MTAAFIASIAPSSPCLAVAWVPPRGWIPIEHDHDGRWTKADGGWVMRDGGCNCFDITIVKAGWNRFVLYNTTHTIVCNDTAYRRSLARWPQHASRTHRRSHAPRHRTRARSLLRVQGRCRRCAHLACSTKLGTRRTQSLKHLLEHLHFQTRQKARRGRWQWSGQRPLSQRSASLGQTQLRLQLTHHGAHRW